MTHLFTQCPHCHTSFKASDEDLQAAEGLVRCGFCLDTFSALEYQINLKEKNSLADIPTEIIEEPNTDTEANLITNKEELHQSLSQLHADDSLESIEPEVFNDLDEPIEIIHTGSGRSGLMTAFLLFSNFALLAFLLGQYGWFNFEEIRLNPRYASISSFVCQQVTCPQSKEQDLSLLSTEELFIHSHPEYENALLVDFIFSNRADFTQAFPIAQLSFNDSQDRLLASRQFTPGEYLPPELRNFVGMPAHSSVQVSLEIVDPGADAINYSLDFK